MKNITIEKRKRRHARIRATIKGTSEIPRLSVFKSNKYFYAQLIDDEKRETIISSSTLKDDNGKSTSKRIESISKEFAEKIKSKKIKSIVFDRGGFPYIGIIKTFATVLRKEGIKF